MVVWTAVHILLFNYMEACPDCFNEGIIREIMRLILDLPRILPPLIIYPLDVKQIIKALKIQQGKSKSFVFEMLTYVRVPS
jgi:hypothetical protein